MPTTTSASPWSEVLRNGDLELELESFVESGMRKPAEIEAVRQAREKEFPQAAF